MNIYALKQKQNKESFLMFAKITTSLEKYFYNQNQETQAEIKKLITQNNINLPLPSGRIGSPLAVALELNFYTCALFLIENADTLGIDINKISSDPNGRNIWNTEETLKMSLQYFNQTINENPFQKNNIEAIEKINEIIKEKPKSYQKKYI